MENRKSRPIVAVVGRPNVGKSTLFNALAGDMLSIVKDTPGITRDRIYADVNWLNIAFTLIDTGGIEPDSKDIILSQMREQAEIAIETADVILFMVDVKQGLTDSDSKVANLLRKSHKPILLVVNKVDDFNKFMPDVYEFYNLGIGEPYPVSSVNRLGIGELLDEVVSRFDKTAGEEEEDERPKVAIVGKPNVEVKDGKLTPEVLWAFGRIGDVTVSPNGDKILYTVKYFDVKKNKGNAEIYSMNIDGSDVKQLTKTSGSEWNCIFNPNGKKIGFCYADTNVVYFM